MESSWSSGRSLSPTQSVPVFHPGHRVLGGSNVRQAPSHPPENRAPDRERRCWQHFLAGCPAGPVGYTQVSCTSDGFFLDSSGSCFLQEKWRLTGPSASGLNFTQGSGPVRKAMGCLLQQNPRRKKREDRGEVPPPGGRVAFGSRGVCALEGSGVSRKRSRCGCERQRMGRPATEKLLSRSEPGTAG